MRRLIMQAWQYDLLYRRGAAWDRYGTGPELRQLVESGRLSPERHRSVLDLGCGTGANAVYLAGQGFDVVGVDFTPIALRQARDRAAAAGVEKTCRFVHGDLSSPSIPGIEQPFDLLVDYSTIDDLPGTTRHAAARTVRRLTRPGSMFFLWCFSVHKKNLPLIAFGRMSRLLHSQMAPGEEKTLFGDAFDIERLPDPARPPHAACFLLTRR
jgi:SAM-dependent methyltransferase